MSIDLSFEIIDVSELTARIKARLEDAAFQQIAIRGEISNFKHHSSQHMYFSLKDEKSRLKAVMFRSRNLYLDFEPTNGMEVIAIGSIGVYEPNGEYQLYVDAMYTAGVGSLHIAFEELKKKLEAEGLFAPDRKRPIPFLPKGVAVITSLTGAAIRDIVSVIRRRYPAMNVSIFPAIVQGEQGPPSIVEQFKLLKEIVDNGFPNDISPFDVVIVGRGGGSIEELWAFNSELVARAIAECPLPVISAVGHETDFTIADFVADCRAATPSAAAELAVPSFVDLIDQVRSNEERLKYACKNLIRQKRSMVEYLKDASALKKPAEWIQKHRQRVDELTTESQYLIKGMYANSFQDWKVLSSKLESISPFATLNRGYAICQTLAGDLITDIDQIEVNQKVKVRLRRGTILAQVEGGELQDGEN